jgi:hypothetical protein
MALEGSISDFSVAEILQSIQQQSRTGILTIYSGEDTVTVNFLQGQIVGTTTSEKKAEDKLGNFLLINKYIGEEDLKQALSEQEQTYDRLGQILLKRRLIDRTSLQKALREQVSQVVSRLLRLKKGFYHFKVEEKIHFDQENMVPIPVEAILMQSIETEDESKSLLRNFSSVEAKLRKTDKAEAFIVEELKRLGDFFAGSEQSGDLSSKYRLPPHEKKLLNEIDGAKSIRRIISGQDHDEVEVLQALTHLKSIGFIEEVAEEAEDSSPKGFVDDFDDFYEEEESRSVLSMVPFLLAGLVALMVFLLGGDPLKPFATDPAAAINDFQKIKLQVNFDRVLTAMRLYTFFHTGQTPLVLEDLVTQGFLEEKYLYDPWGNRLKYRISQFRLILESAGPDRSYGTADDIPVAAKFLPYTNPPAAFFPPTLDDQKNFLKRQGYDL